MPWVTPMDTQGGASLGEGNTQRGERPVPFHCVTCQFVSLACAFASRWLFTHPFCHSVHR